MPGAAPTAFSTSRTGITEVKVVGLRRKIAEQMVKSKSSIPHFSFFEEVDVTELEELRQMLNASKHDSQPKLSYLPFIMLALAKICLSIPSAMHTITKRRVSFIVTLQSTLVSLRRPSADYTSQSSSTPRLWIRGRPPPSS